MSNNSFTLEDIQLMEDAVQCFSTETSRRLSDQDRIPEANPVVKSQLTQTRNELKGRLDKLAILRAKLITERTSLQTPAEPEQTSPEE